MSMLEKVSFVKNIEKALKEGQIPKIERIDYNCYYNAKHDYTYEFLVVTFKSGDIAVRNCYGNSCYAIFLEIPRLIQDDYHKEDEYFLEEIANNPDVMQITDVDLWNTLHNNKNGLLALINEYYLEEFGEDTSILSEIPANGIIELAYTEYEEFDDADLQCSYNLNEDKYIYTSNGVVILEEPYDRVSFIEDLCAGDFTTFLESGVEELEKRYGKEE